MTHLEDEQIQRLLHGELRAPDEAPVRAHLSGCEDCRRAMRDAEEENDQLRALLGQLDHQPPFLPVTAIVARARRRPVAWVRLAAGILLSASLAGVAYAAPGSPVPGWIATAGRLLTGTASPAVPNVPAPPPPAPELAGIALAPGARLTIVFTAPQVAGTADVMLTDDADIVVRVPTGGATFTSEASRLVIDNRGSSASFQILIPRAAPQVEILLGGTRLFLKSGGRIVVDTSAQPRDSFSLSLQQRSP